MVRVGNFQSTVIVVAAIMLSACGTNPDLKQKSSRTAEIDATNQKISALFKAQLSTCMNQKFEKLRLISPCQTENITFTQLANNTKITNQERKLFIQASTQLDAFGKQITETYRDADIDGANKIANARAWAHTQALENRLALINKEITWGEYLKQRMNIDASMRRQAQ
jgi:hypothetical protein